jgi:hypothetical protein
MEIIIPLFEEFSLRIADGSRSPGKYPTAFLQKGLRLFHKDLELSEEGVGFGVPVIKLGLKTLFPGKVELTHTQYDSHWEIVALYHLNLQEKVGKKGSESVRYEFITKIQNYLAAIYRRFPSTRKILTFLSNSIRQTFQWETQYSRSKNDFEIKISYNIQPITGSIKVDVDSSNLPREIISEIILMNEQGANTFNRYTDLNGVSLEGKDISQWQQVSAESAAFLSEEHKVAFALNQIDGAKLYSGRELSESRLAWSGFGYSIPSTLNHFCYEIKIERLP